MDRAQAKRMLTLAKNVDSAIATLRVPPSDTVAPPNQPILPHSLFLNTRGYIQRVVHQINACYIHSCYDACAVMIRRLLEVLLIEAFLNHRLGNVIKDVNGDYLYLSDLVNKALAEPAFNFGRATKKALKSLKTVGDQSAHSRRYNAKREYIDAEIVGLRAAAEELLYEAGLRN